MARLARIGLIHVFTGRRHVCPSVCPSNAGTVTKRRKLGSRNLQLPIAQGLLAIYIHPDIRNGSSPTRALNESGTGIMSFSTNNAVSQKWFKTGPSLLLMTNRKSHMPFRLVPKSTTLVDFERPIRTLLHKTCLSEPTTKI